MYIGSTTSCKGLYKTVILTKLKYISISNTILLAFSTIIERVFLLEYSNKEQENIQILRDPLPNSNVSQIRSKGGCHQIYNFPKFKKVQNILGRHFFNSHASLNKFFDLIYEKSRRGRKAKKRMLLIVATNVDCPNVDLLKHRTLVPIINNDVFSGH